MEKAVEFEKKFQRVLLIGDKEAQNLDFILHQCDQEESLLDFAGMIVPGGNIDHELMRQITFFGDRYEGVVGSPIEGGLEFGVGTFGRFPEDKAQAMEQRMQEKYASFFLQALPYDAKLFKENPGKRKEYNQELLERILFVNPDIVFLSNFKIILDQKIPETLKEHGIKIINVHPSVLPLNKGWRTELAAFKGKNPTSNGYTFHFVVPELDSGAVLFSREVPVEDYDESYGNNSFKNEQQDYEKFKEERIRQRLINDQANFSPKVLEIVAKNYPQKIVEDAEAFAYEGRPGFEETDEFKASLQEDYAHWKKGKTTTVSFDEWKQKHRIPYRRVLFDTEGTQNFQTVENIIGSKNIPIEEVGKIKFRTYFTIPVRGISNTDFYLKFHEAIGPENHTASTRISGDNFMGYIEVTDITKFEKAVDSLGGKITKTEKLTPSVVSKRMPSMFAAEKEV